MNRIYILLIQLSDKKRVLLVEMNLEITYFKGKGLLPRVELNIIYVMMRKVQIISINNKPQMMTLKLLQKHSKKKNSMKMSIKRLSLMILCNTKFVSLIQSLSQL